MREAALLAWGAAAISISVLISVTSFATVASASLIDRPGLALESPSFDFYDEIWEPDGEREGEGAEEELKSLAHSANDKRSNFGGNFLARASKRSVGENFMARASKRSFGDNFMARASKRGDLGSHFMARASKRDLGGNFLARASKRSKRSPDKRDFGSHFLDRASRSDVKPMIRGLNQRSMDEILEKVRNALPTRHRSFLDGNSVRGKRVYFFNDDSANANKNSDQWTRPRRVIVDNLFARTTRGANGWAPKIFHDDDDQMELMQILNGGYPWRHY